MPTGTQAFITVRSKSENLFRYLTIQLGTETVFLFWVGMWNGRRWGDLNSTVAIFYKIY